jgi:hypothetical protein
MFDLITLRKLNAKRCASPKAETTSSRHCSHCVSVRGTGRSAVTQVVLHSARHRNTAFIEGRAAKQFLVEFQSTNSQTRQNALIERWYNTIPTGKQNIVG